MTVDIVLRRVERESFPPPFAPALPACFIDKLVEQDPKDIDWGEPGPRRRGSRPPQGATVFADGQRLSAEARVKVEDMIFRAISTLGGWFAYRHVSGAIETHIPARERNAFVAATADTWWPAWEDKLSGILTKFVRQGKLQREHVTYGGVIYALPGVEKKLTFRGAVGRAAEILSVEKPGEWFAHRDIVQALPRVPVEELLPSEQDQFLNFPDLLPMYQDVRSQLQVLAADGILSRRRAGRNYVYQYRGVGESIDKLTEL